MIQKEFCGKEGPAFVFKMYLMAGRSFEENVPLL